MLLRALAHALRARSPCPANSSPIPIHPKITFYLDFSPTLKPSSPSHAEAQLFPICIAGVLGSIHPVALLFRALLPLAGLSQDHKQFFMLLLNIHIDMYAHVCTHENTRACHDAAASKRSGQCPTLTAAPVSLLI